METEREVHTKEFQSQMFASCFNECVTSFSTTNLTASEGKCLKGCYVAVAKRLETAGQAMGYEVKLAHNFN